MPSHCLFNFSASYSRCGNISGGDALYIRNVDTILIDSCLSDQQKSLMALKLVAISASEASIIASAANGGGTKTQDTFAPSSTASLTVSHIGKPNVSCPPFPGVTPPTSLVQ